MKLLAASDLHGSHAVYEWLVRQACDADLMVLAGDLLGCPEGFGAIEDAQCKDADDICRILGKAPCSVYYIMGNDDLVALDPKSDGIIPLHGRRHDVGRWNLVGYQYSLPFMGGIYEKSEEAIHDDLSQLAEVIDAQTVLVTHNPAYGVQDIGVLDVHAGSQAILDVVTDKNVRAHIHGHIHENFGRLGRHFNVAAAGRHRAMMIDLETMDSTILRG